MSQFLNPIDVYTSTRFTIFIFRVFGLAPYNVIPDESRFKLSKLGVIINILTLIMFINIVVIGYRSISDINYPHITNISLMMDVFQYTAGIVLALLAVLVSNLKGRKLLYLTSEIFQVDKRLKKIHIDVQLRTMHICMLISMFAGLLILGILLLVTFLHLQKDNYNLPFIFGLGLPYYKMVNFLMECLFAKSSISLLHRFKIINKRLSQLIKNARSNPRHVKFLPLKSKVDSIERNTGRIYISESSKIPLTQQQEQLAVSPGIPVTTLSQQRLDASPILRCPDAWGVGNCISVASQLHEIASLHDKLCTLGQQANAIYSVPLLLYIAVAFIEITGVSFGIIRILILMADNKEIQSGYVVHGVIWGAWTILKLVTLVAISSFACDQANRSATLVHKLINKTRDPAIRDELVQFSKQLLHRKLQFTACGFFALDFTLLYSFVGAVSTYLVILVQFQYQFAKS